MAKEVDWEKALFELVEAVDAATDDDEVAVDFCNSVCPAEKYCPSETCDSGSCRIAIRKWAEETFTKE